MTTEEVHQPPPVLLWYRLYCGVEGSFYVLDGVVGLAFVLFREQLGASNDFIAAPQFLVFGIVALGMGLLMSVVYGATFFLPRKPWAWVYHLIILGIGMTGCFLPVCVPLMIFWLRPQTRTYFGCDQWLK